MKKKTKYILLLILVFCCAISIATNLPGLYLRKEKLVVDNNGYYTFYKYRQFNSSQGGMIGNNYKKNYNVSVSLNKYYVKDKYQIFNKYENLVYKTNNKNLFIGELERICKIFNNEEIMVLSLCVNSSESELLEILNDSSLFKEYSLFKEWFYPFEGAHMEVPNNYYTSITSKSLEEIKFVCRYWDVVCVCGSDAFSKYPEENNIKDYVRNILLMDR